MTDDDTKRQLLAIHADYQFWTVAQGVGSPEASEALARLEAACRAARVKLPVALQEKGTAATITRSCSIDTPDGEVSVMANDNHLLLAITSGINGSTAGTILDRSHVEKVVNALNSWLAGGRPGLGDDDGSV